MQTSTAILGGSAATTQVAPCLGLGTMPCACCADLAVIAERMRNVKHKILVLSGKGGVGKSTFSAQLAFALASKGKEVRAGLAHAAFSAA